MSPRVSPTSSPRRLSYVSSSLIDPYNRAEQGLPAILTALDPPPQARASLSYRLSLHNSESTASTGFPPSQQGALNEKIIRPDISRKQTRSSSTTLVPENSRWWSSKENRPKSDTYQEGYERFEDASYMRHPDGWPRLAAFLDGCDFFSILRRFGQSHVRLLLLHQMNITDLEYQIAELDKKDEEGGVETNWRLKNRFHADGLDTTKIDLIQQLEDEILQYDTLLLKHHQLKNLDQTPEMDHRSVFRWLWDTRPVDNREFSFIYQHEDFVSVVSPNRNRFEKFLIRQLGRWPKSIFKSPFKIKSQPDQTPDDKAVEYFCKDRITTFARLLAVFFAVLVLILPVILFFLVSLNRTCQTIVLLSFVFTFAIVISLFTDASVQEIFIGSATYCAVLVTFLGNLQDN